MAPITLGPRPTLLLALLLLLPYSHGNTNSRLHHDSPVTHENDFAFDDNGDGLQREDCRVKRLWGVPDMPAYIGRMFQLHIPKEAFSGNVAMYKATGSEGPLPSWLWLDSHRGILRGVPGPADRGEHRLRVTAVPTHNEPGHCNHATDVFTIEVKDKRDSPLIGTRGEHQCHMGEDEIRLVIIISKPFQQIRPKQRLNAIAKISKFMGLDYSNFVIQPHEASKDNDDHDVLMSGSTETKKKYSKASSEIELTVGCNTVIWAKHSIIVHQMKQQVLDGTASDVIALPVSGWKVIRHNQKKPLLRKQRQVFEGSAYDDEESEDYKNGYEDDYEEYEDYESVEKEKGKHPITIEPQTSNKTEDDNIIVAEDEFRRIQVEPNNIMPVIIPSVDNTTEEVTKEETQNVPTLPIIPETVTTPIIRFEPSLPQTEKDEIGSPTPPIKVTDNTYFDVFAASTAKETTPYDVTTTERSSTIIGRTTETVDFGIPANSPPQKQHRTKKVAVTAGKYFSYIIPEDMFIDEEDGTNLQLAMYDIEHSPLKVSSWVQFDPKTREVYGLPLEEHVSKWEYLVEATDSSGASVTDTLDITVQQHKGRRTVNHEFSMKLRVQKKYPAVVDWQIRVLKGLVNLFRDTDMDQITVREIDLESDPMVFVWTNDTLPRNFCPNNDIDRLMGMLQTNPEGDPSPGLVSAMSPELRVKSVAWKGTGACQAPPTPPAPQPPFHPDNFGPMPRNQIDHINATVGKLLIYKVPEDTFYDPEDGSARNLKMWLTKGDRSALSPHNWLQFDSKNQEFYGLPLDKDIGRKDYQLVCEDSGGLTANDGLMVEVHPGHVIKPPVEFQITLDTPYDAFVQSAAMKRKFIEKLQHLFGDPDTSLIKIKSFSYRPTVVSWYNASLPNDRCPEEKLKQLRNVLVGNDGSVTERADVIMGAEFPVISVSFVPRGACSIGGPVVQIPELPPNLGVPGDDASKTVNSDDYLITFIVPIVVIVCMIFIAALIAYILYKRRRTGKMSVGDDEERQAFRSKGIPVIFQDELDEKPDPSNKSPVIMKEEKPPLLPPPEYKGMDSNSPTPSHTPYHPPPPFTASRDTARNNRPKNPTYRKPPPYVPP